MSPRPRSGQFNDYTVLQRKADPPRESWWICADLEFHDRWTREVQRMQLHPVNRTIYAPVIDWRAP